MVSHDIIIERTGHREDIEQPCRPISVESVYPRSRNIGDGQEEDIQISLCIFLYIQDLGNLTRYSFNVQESGARINQVEPSGKVLNIMPNVDCSRTLSF